MQFLSKKKKSDYGWLCNWRVLLSRQTIVKHFNFFLNISFVMFSAIKTRYRRQVDLPLLCHTNHETSFVYFNFLLSLHLRLESCSLMAAAYSLGQSENCVKRLRQFVFNLVFHVSRFLSRFDTTPIRRKRAWLVLCWEVCPRTKSSSYLTQHPTSFATLWLFDSDFSTSLQEFFPGFCGFPFSPGGLFLENPETFRAYFGCHNSLYIFTTPRF